MRRRRKAVSSARSLQLEHKVPRKESTKQLRFKTAIRGLLAREKSRGSNKGKLTM